MIDVTFGSISNRLGKPEFLALREYMDALPKPVTPAVGVSDE
jgi:hypothetical protein